MTQILAWIPNAWEIAIIVALGFLFFGKKLPELGKSLGQSFVEFKRGLNGIEDIKTDINALPNDKPKELPK